MTVALGDAHAAALGAGVKALEHRRRIDLDARHFQIVDIGVEIVVGIGDRGIQHLEHDLRAFFGMNFKVLTASVADLPRIVSTTKRHFCGEMRA